MDFGNVRRRKEEKFGPTASVTLTLEATQELAVWCSTPFWVASSAKSLMLVGLKPVSVDGALANLEQFVVNVYMSSKQWAQCVVDNVFRFRGVFEMQSLFADCTHHGRYLLAERSTRSCEKGGGCHFIAPGGVCAFCPSEWWRWVHQESAHLECVKVR